MAADANLIRLQQQLSAVEAGANYPNLKPYYESSANIAKKGFEIIGGAIDELKQDQADEEARVKPFIESLQTNANGVYKAIYELEETLPNKVVNAINDEIEMMQEDLRVLLN